jgi:hypothetical protein
VNKVVLGFIFLGILRFCLVRIIPPLLCTNLFVYNRSYIFSAIDSIVKQHTLNQMKSTVYIFMVEINSTYFRSDRVIWDSHSEKILKLTCEENAWKSYLGSWFIHVNRKVGDFRCFRIVMVLYMTEDPSVFLQSLRATVWCD